MIVRHDVIVIVLAITICTRPPSGDIYCNDDYLEFIAMMKTYHLYHLEILLRYEY